MKRKKPTTYDAQEALILKQSSNFVDFLMRAGMLEDQAIEDEKVRKAKKSTKQKAYHNTETLLNQYRLIVWVLECAPGELAQELSTPLEDIDRLAEKIDLATALGDKRVESQVNAMMKTRFLVDRVHDALSVLQKKPGNGELLYSVIYNTYIDPDQRTHDEIINMLHLSERTYYRLRKEAITIMSIRLWSAPTGDVDAWLEVLTLLQGM